MIYYNDDFFRNNSEGIRGRFFKNNSNNLNNFFYEQLESVKNLEAAWRREVG